MNQPAALVFPDNLAALALARELGAAGVRVAVMAPTKNGPGAYSRYSVFVEAPDFYLNPREWLDFACQWASGLESKPVLFPTEDAALLLAEQNRDQLSEVFDYSCAGPGVVDRITDKRKLYADAAGLGLDVPDSREVDRAEDAVELDADAWLVKPPCRYLVTGEGVTSFLQTSGGAKALGANPSTDARTLIDAGFPAIVQEKIPGDHESLLSVAISMDRDGRIIDAFCARKQCEYPEPYGDGLLVDLVEDRGLIERSAGLLRNIDYWGMCDLEFKRDERDGRYKLLDANPRGWLWMSVGTAAGHRLATAAYECATGVTLPKAASASSVRGRWVSPRGAAAFMSNTYRPGKHGPWLPLRLLCGVARTAATNLRAYSDPIYAGADAWRGLLASIRASRARSAS